MRRSGASARLLRSVLRRSATMSHPRDRLKANHRRHGGQPAGLLSSMPRDSADEVAQLVRTLKLSSEEGRVLTRLADEAVMKFDSDTDAVGWFEGQLQSRHPFLWRSIIQTIPPIGC